MEKLELIPGRGVRRDDIDIFFGMPRDAVRKALGKPNETMWDDEDEYEVGGDDWLRLRYLDGKLCDIEVLGGSLMYETIELKDAHIRDVKFALHNIGIVIDDETEWLSEGRDCIDLQCVFATCDDIGEAGGDRVAWVIASSDFRVE
ncbi:hypothetical protein KPL74_19270 [Bacillus sp. NP157]|nr:hypothetical protein KPL74_19270 [Bacillus sp. NP157]